jgi:hypothetical protein
MCWRSHLQMAFQLHVVEGTGSKADQARLLVVLCREAFSPRNGHRQGCMDGQNRNGLSELGYLRSRCRAGSNKRRPKEGGNSVAGEGACQSASVTDSWDGKLFGLKS